MDNDFNIKVTVRNARLLRAIREKFGTAAELARVSGLNQTQVSALLTMRDRPFLKNGQLSSAAESIVSALGVPADDLWPDHIRRLKAKRATVEIEMDAQSFMEIAVDGPEQGAIFRQAIGKWSKRLSEREISILSMRAGGATLDEAGSAHEVSRERLRQIEARAMRKMREAAKKDGVQELQDLLC